MSQDYRYIAPDGTEVEAWQLTDTSRYQDKTFPKWLTSRMFMTVDGTEDYLVQGDKEQKIPPYGWLVHDGVGISIVPAFDFEAYDKVVKEAAPLQEPPQAAVDPLMPGDPVLDELKAIYEAGEKGGAEEVHKELKKAIGRRIHWCECPPGQCVGANDQGADRFGCRQFSPLIK